MQVHLCDAKPCRKEIPKDKLKQVMILDKFYDLCPECATSFEQWVKDNLENGVTPINLFNPNGYTLQPYTITTTNTPADSAGRYEFTWIDHSGASSATTVNTTLNWVEAWMEQDPSRRIASDELRSDTRPFLPTVSGITELPRVNYSALDGAFGPDWIS